MSLPVACTPIAWTPIPWMPVAWMPGTTEWIIILIVALLLFGRRLPEVMRSMGRGVVEFKKGLRGIEDDMNVDHKDVDRPLPSAPDRKEPTSLS